MLDSPEGVCAGQAGSEYPATFVPFSNNAGLTFCLFCHRFRSFANSLSEEIAKNNKETVVEDI
jgi:hypothetical protein